MYRLLMTLGCVAALAGCGGADKSSAGPSQPDDDDAERSGQRRVGIPDADDDDDDELQIEGLRGRLSAQDIDAGIKPHKGDLTDCWTTRVKRTTHIGGKVELKWEIARDGSVKWVQVTESDLGSWQIEKCLIEVSMRMSFVKPKGGEVDFTLPLEFPATREVLWWSADKGEEAVADMMPELAECADKAGTQDPSNVWATVYVGVRGKVMGAGFASSDKLPMPIAWADCAESVVTAWTLDDPMGRIVKAGFRYNPE